MEDRVIMDNILTATKGACDLLMHGTIESSTPAVHSAFKMSLDECLAISRTKFIQKCLIKAGIPRKKQSSRKLTKRNRSLTVCNKKYARGKPAPGHILLFNIALKLQTDSLRPENIQSDREARQP